jgi:hypothetical protein
MSTDVFGDLRQWNRVLEELEHLKTRGLLDEHQDGLARLLRYRFNWRIREKAVQSLSTLSAPEDHILAIVLEIIADEHTEFTLRTLAAESLGGLFSKRQNQGQWDDELARTVLQKLGETVNPHHPVDFQRAIKRLIDRARQHDRVAAAI